MLPDVGWGFGFNECGSGGSEVVCVFSTRARSLHRPYANSRPFRNLPTTLRREIQAIDSDLVSAQPMDRSTIPRRWSRVWRSAIGPLASEVSIPPPGVTPVASGRDDANLQATGAHGCRMSSHLDFTSGVSDELVSCESPGSTHCSRCCWCPVCRPRVHPRPPRSRRDSTRRRRA